MNGRSATAFATLLFVGIWTAWSPQFWPVALFQTGVFLFGLVWAARLVVWREPVRGAMPLVPLAGVVLWGLAQLATRQTIYRFDTWRAVLGWFTNLVVFLIALQVLYPARNRDRFLKAVLLCGFALSVISVSQWFTSAGRIFWLVPGPHEATLGPFVYKNQYAAFIELIFPLAIYQSLADRHRSLLYAAMAAAMFATVVAGASRAGLILVAGELLALLYLAWFQRLVPARNLGVALLKTLAMCLAFTAVVGWQAIRDRFHQAGSYEVRRELLASSLAMVRDRPWTGFGLGTWQTAYPAYARFDNGLVANQAHNDWAQWAAEGGLPFLGLLLSVAVWSVGPAIRSLWGLGIVSVFLHGLVDYPFGEPALAGLLFALLGALAAWRKQIPPKPAERRMFRFRPVELCTFP